MPGDENFKTEKPEMAAATMPLTGNAAPPMANGEVVFDAPWQSRVFGMARVLCEQGVYEWDEFRDCLIQRIADWQRDSSQEEYYYFNHFLAAFTDLVTKNSLCSSEEITQRTVLLESRPHGHDH
jgi:nitrile hydratase accessory protein